MSQNNKKYSDLSKIKLLELVTKSSHLLNRWTESIILIGAELFIVYPQHEVFKGDFFAKNTLILILNRVRTMLEVSNIKRVVIEYKDGRVDEHVVANIEKICEKYSNGLKK